MKWKTPTKHHPGKVRCRLRRPEGWHELEGRAERECREGHCGGEARTAATRELMPVRRPLGKDLTGGRLGSFLADRLFSNSRLPRTKENKRKAQAWGWNQNEPPQAHGWAHATPTPERMLARGLARRDWREFNERRDRSGWPAGRGWPGIPGTGEAHGGRVCTAKGMAEGSDLACEGRAAKRRPPEAVTAPRNNCARADGAATAQASLRASGRRAGSGVCTPGLRLLTQNAPPRAPEFPLPAPAILLAVRRGCILSVTLNVTPRSHMFPKASRSRASPSGCLCGAERGSKTLHLTPPKSPFPLRQSLWL